MVTVGAGGRAVVVVVLVVVVVEVVDVVVVVVVGAEQPPLPFDDWPFGQLTVKEIIMGLDQTVPVGSAHSAYCV